MATSNKNTTATKKSKQSAVKKEPKKKGRPEAYSQEIADKICLLIATTSKSLRTICKGNKMPCVQTILRWLREDTNGFLAQYTRAKEEQADFLVEEMLEISDDGSKDEKAFVGINHIHRARLKVDTRKFIAAKLKPKKYGDKLDITTNNNPINGIIDLSKVPESTLKELLNAGAENANDKKE